MMIEAWIEIPELDANLWCDISCPLFIGCKDNSLVRVIEAERYVIKPVPGPSCPGPGVYRLAREEELAKLEAEKAELVEALRNYDSLRGCVCEPCLYSADIAPCKKDVAWYAVISLLARIEKKEQ